MVLVFFTKQGKHSALSLESIRFSWLLDMILWLSESDHSALFLSVFTVVSYVFIHDFFCFGNMMFSA